MTIVANGMPISEEAVDPEPVTPFAVPTLSDFWKTAPAYTSALVITIASVDASSSPNLSNLL